MKKYNQKGFAFVELLLVAAVIAVLALVTMKVRHNTTKAAESSKGVSTISAHKESSAVTTIPTILDKSDLDKALASLDQNDTSDASHGDDSLLAAQGNDY